MIPILRQELEQWMGRLETRGINTKLILVDDGSADRSFDLLPAWTSICRISPPSSNR